MRSSLAGLLAAALILGCAAAAAAQPAAWPTKPVMIPTPPGGGNDNLIRPLLQPLSEALGQPVVVETRSGASGAIAVEALKQSPKDGHTLLITNNALLVVLPNIRKVDYDPMVDLAPVAMLAETVTPVAVRASLPVTTFQQFLDYCRANPGKVSDSTNGNGSISHIRNEMLNQQGKLGMVHVPYKGDGEAIIDLLAGNIDMMAGISVLNHVGKGQIRLLAFMTPQRHPDYPDIPTVREVGLPNFEAPTWYALFAPGGASAPAIKRMNEAVATVLAKPEIGRTLLKLGYVVQVQDVPTMTATVRAHDALYRKVIAEMNLKDE